MSARTKTRVTRTATQLHPALHETHPEPVVHHAKDQQIWQSDLGAFVTRQSVQRIAFAAASTLAMSFLRSRTLTALAAGVTGVVAGVAIFRGMMDAMAKQHA